MAACAGATAGAAAAASGGLNDEAEELARKVNNFICQILAKLDKNAIAKRDMNLCEAFCLLWHHRGRGTVDGRQSSNELISCLYAAVLVDLWAAGKIEINVKEKTTCTGMSLKADIKVVDATKTKSCLDAAGFNEILRCHAKGKSKELKEWLKGCVNHTADTNCASVILDTFVEKGIIEKEKKWFGLKTDYPTKDKEPQIQLVLEIRGVTLKDKAPDGFMGALLPLLRFADKLHSSFDPMLGRHYNQEEYDKAKPCLNKILHNSGYVEL